MVVGPTVGPALGAGVGPAVGSELVGTAEGEPDGAADGAADGTVDGTVDGTAVGDAVMPRSKQWSRWLAQVPRCSVPRQWYGPEHSQRPLGLPRGAGQVMPAPW